MPKDGQNNTNQEVEKALDYEQVVKSSIMFDTSAGEDLLAGVANDKELKQIISSELFDEIHTYQNNEEDGTSIFEQAFIEKPQGYDKLMDQAGNQVNLLKIKDKKAYDKYRSIIAQGADKLDEFIDKSVVVNDEYGEKAKEFIVTCSTGRIRRSVNGGADRYLQYKHLLGGGNASMYAAINASVVDNRLQNNIEKWQHKMPIHQLVIDGGKQLQTMTDYWAEKEKNKGVLPPDREQKYRQELYDQVISMIPLYDKMVSTLEDEQANVDMDEDKLFGNQSFHIHPRSIRGSASLKCGLHAMKVGLENGWAIEDTARLAAFYQVVYKTESQLICNGGMEYDNFEMYDKPKYQSPEHERYMDRLKSAWEIVEETKLEAPGERKAILSNLDKLVKEGLEKGYFDKSSGPAHYYQQAVKQAVVRDSLVASGVAPAFHDQKSNIKTGEERRFDVIFSKMNASRIGSESPEHKNMRVALEELKTFLKENPKQANLSNEDFEKYNRQYLNKLDAVKKTTEIYKNTHPAPKTSAGKARLQGADQASMLVGIEIDNVMQELTKRKLCSRADTMESYQFKASAKENGYSAAIMEQTKKVDDMIAALKSVDGLIGSTDFKNMQAELKGLKDYAENFSKDTAFDTYKVFDAYNKKLEDVGRLAVKCLDDKKALNPKYAKCIRSVAKTVKEGIKTIKKSNKDFQDDLKLHDKLEKQKKVNELLGDTYKLYDQLDYVADGSVFWGEKYKDPATRENRPSGYSLSRSAGVSISIFALANTGKYSFEDIMDPTKLQAEKREMFDKVVKAMSRNTSDNQKWIAETIYNGQKNTENMMNEAAKNVDFINADITTDKTYCQMLHMSQIQFDAWQEMKHCENEILDLAKKDHPEMTKWEDYKDWWNNRQGVIGRLNTAIRSKKDSMVSIVDGDMQTVPKILQYSIDEKLIKNALVEAQTTKKDSPFVDWVSPDIDMKCALTDMVGHAYYIEQKSYLVDNPETTKAIINQIADGSLVKDVSVNADLKEGKVEITGFPSVDEIKQMAEAAKKGPAAEGPSREVPKQEEKKAEATGKDPTETFLAKTDEALNRLETGKYDNRQSFIEDSAYAMIGQMYRANGGKLPNNKDGGNMTLEDYKNMQISSKAFVDSLMVPGSPDKFISPKKIAAMANNSQKIHNMAKDRAAEMNNNKTVQQNLAQRRPAPVKKTVNQKQAGVMGGN